MALVALSSCSSTFFVLFFSTLLRVFWRLFNLGDNFSSLQSWTLNSVLLLSRPVVCQWMVECDLWPSAWCPALKILHQADASDGTFKVSFPLKIDLHAIFLRNGLLRPSWGQLSHPRVSLSPLFSLTMNLALMLFFWNSSIKTKFTYHKIHLFKCTSQWFFCLTMILDYCHHPFSSSSSSSSLPSPPALSLNPDPSPLCFSYSSDRLSCFCCLVLFYFAQGHPQMAILLLMPPM
jgi:hypothetical protein